MLERAFASLLTKYASEYVYGLDSANFRTRLLRGTIELKDIFLKPRVLNIIPGVQLELGHIGKCFLRMPWNRFQGESISVEIFTIHLVISERPPVALDALKDQLAKYIKNKLCSIAQTEQSVCARRKQQILEAAGVQVKEKAAKPGKIKQWLIKLQNLVINNVEVHVSEVTVVWLMPMRSQMATVLFLKELHTATVQNSKTSAEAIKQKECALNDLELFACHFSVPPTEPGKMCIDGCADVSARAKVLEYWKSALEREKKKTLIESIIAILKIDFCPNFIEHRIPLFAVNLELSDITCRSDLQFIFVLVKSISAAVSAGELAFVLSKADSKKLEEGLSLDDAVVWLSETLFCNTLKERLGTSDCSANGLISGLKTQLHEQFKMHYLSHLRFKYIAPHLLETKLSVTSLKFHDPVLGSVQAACDYTGPSAQILTDLTASIPSVVISKLQQECLSLFFKDLPLQVQLSKREAIDCKKIAQESGSADILSESDVVELKKLAGAQSTFDVYGLEEEDLTRGNNDPELVHIGISLNKITMEVCDGTIRQPQECQEQQTSLLTLQLNAFSCMLSLLKSSNFKFDCQIGQLQGSCAEINSVVHTAEAQVAFTLMLINPGKFGGSMHLQIAVAPLHITFIPDLLPFVLNLLNTLWKEPENPISLPIRNASAFDIITYYNVDETITTFLQERAATLELDIKFAAPILFVTDPSGISLTCRLGIIAIQSEYLFRRKSSNVVPANVHDLGLLITLTDAEMFAIGTPADISAENSALPIIRPISLSIHALLPLTAREMEIDIKQERLDIVITAVNFDLFMNLSNAYVHKLIQNNTFAVYLSTFKQRPPAPPKRQQTKTLNALTETAQMFSKQVCKMNLNVKFAGVRIELGDTGEIKLCVEQGVFSAKKGDVIAFTMQLHMFVILLYDNVIVYFSDDNEDSSCKLVVSGTLQTDSTIDLIMHTGVLHGVINTFLLVNATLVLSTILRPLESADFPLLIQQVENYSLTIIQKIERPKRPSLSINMAIIFGGLEVQIFGSTYAFSLLPHPDVKLLSSMCLTTAHFTISLTTAEIALSWSIGECTVKSHEPERADLSIPILNIAPPELSTHCITGTIKLCRHSNIESNLVLDCKVLTDVVLIAHGRAIRYILSVATLVKDCSTRLIDSMTMKTMKNGTNLTSKREQRRYSDAVRPAMNVVVSQVKVILPVRPCDNDAHFSLLLVNIAIKQDNDSSDSVIKHSICVDKLECNFLSPEEGSNPDTSQQIVSYERLALYYTRSYTLFTPPDIITQEHNAQKDTNSNSVCLLTNQIVLAEITSPFYIALSQVIFSKITEMVSIEGNLGFSLLDDSDAAELTIIRDAVISKLEVDSTDVRHPSSENIMQNMNKLLSHSSGGLLSDRFSSKCLELNLNDTFLDIVEAEYIALRTLGKLNVEPTEQAAMYNPPSNFLATLSFCAVHVTLKEGSTLICDLNLDSSTFHLKTSPNLILSGNLGTLALCSDKRALPALELTPWTCRYELMHTSNEAAIKLSQAIALTLVFEENLVRSLIVLSTAAHSPSPSNVALRQQKQELAHAIVEGLMCGEDREIAKRKRHSISNAILSILNIDQGKKTVATDRPRLSAEVPLLSVKLSVPMVDFDDAKATTDSLLSAEHIYLSLNISASFNLLFRQKYIYSPSTRQVYDFFEHSDMDIKVGIQSCKVAVIGSVKDSTAFTSYVEDALLLAEMSFTASRSVNRTQERIGSEEKDRITNRTTLTASANIPQQTRIAISPHSVRGALILKMRVLSSIPYQVLQKLREMALEELKRAKDWSLPQNWDNTAYTDKDKEHHLILNPNPIVISGRVFPTYDISSTICVDVLFTEKILFTAAHLSKESPPLFILKLSNTKCRYESTSTESTRQHIGFDTSLQIESFNTALKLYVLLLHTVPLSLQYSRCSEKAQYINIEELDLSPSVSVGEVWKHMEAESAILICTKSHISIFITPTTLLNLSHLRTAFLSPTINEEASTAPKNANSEVDSDTSLILFMESTLIQQPNTRKQQVIEYYPGAAVRSFKVYNGACENAPIITASGSLMFCVVYTALDESTIWLEFAADGVIRTDQLSINFLKFHRYHKLNETWLLISSQEGSNLYIHCISSCILFNYTTEVYALCTEKENSGVSSTSTEIVSYSETTDTTLAHDHHRMKEELWVPAILRARSYVSISSFVSSVQIQRQGSGPLELSYYRSNNSMDGHEIFLLEPGYGHLKLITYTIELIELTIRVIQLVPIYVVEHRIPCIACLKMEYVHTDEGVAPKTIQNESINLLPGETATLTAAANNSMCLTSMSLDLPYGITGPAYALRERCRLTFDDDALESPMQLSLTELSHPDSETYYCSVVTTEQTMEPLNGGIALLAGLRTPASLRIRLYANVLVQNLVRQDLSFTVFRLSSSTKRTPLTPLITYGNAAIMWGKGSDALKLFVDKNGSAPYHKSEAFMISSFTANHLHCFSSARKDRHTTLFIGAVSRPADRSPSLLYVLCPAIKIINRSERIMQISIQTLKRSSTDTQSTFSVTPGATVPVFELPGDTKSLTDYSVQFLEEKPEQVHRIKADHTHYMVRTTFGVTILEIQCADNRLQIIVRPPGLGDELRITIHNGLDMDLYCMCRKHFPEIKYLVNKESSVDLCLSLSNLDFYGYDAKGKLQHLFCIDPAVLDRRMEYRIPRIGRKCSVRMSVEDNVLCCYIAFIGNSLQRVDDKTHKVSLQSVRLHVQLDIKPIRISLIGPDPESFARRAVYALFTIASIDATALLTDQFYLLSFKCGRVVLENTLESAGHPLVIAWDPITPKEQNKEKKDSPANDQNDPAIFLLACTSFQPYFLNFKATYLQLGRLSLCVDQAGLDTMLQFLRSTTLFPIRSWRGSAENSNLQTQLRQSLTQYTEKRNTAYNLLLAQLCTAVFHSQSQIADCGFRHLGVSPTVYIGRLQVNNIKLNLTVAIEKFPFLTSEIISLVARLGTILFSIDNAHMRIAPILLREQLMSLAELKYCLQAIYTKQLCMNAGRILIASPILGSVGPFMDHIIAGLQEPGEAGISRFENFVRHSTAGVTGVALALLSSIGELLSIASMDAKYAKLRSAGLRVSQRSAQTAWRNSGQMFLTGIKSAFAGVVSKPRKGFVANNVQGFFKGLGQGLIGLAAKTLGSISDTCLNIMIGFNGRVNKIYVKSARVDGKVFTGAITEDMLVADGEHEGKKRHAPK